MTDPDPASAGSAAAWLAAYIRANRDRYTRDALTETLIREGHAPDAVAEAWRLADADAGAAAPSGSEQGLEPMRARQTILSTIAILLGFGALVAGELALLAASGGRPMMLLYVVLYPIQIILVIRWIVGRIGSSRDLRGGDAAMTAGWLIIPVIALAAIMGVCAGYGGVFGCVIHC